MSTDQEIKSMCWYQQGVIDEMNRFVDLHIKNHDITQHMKPLTDLLDLCPQDSNLIDLGTGTAMIAPLCNRFRFHGADLPHIIAGCAMRNQPQYFYRSCDLIEGDLAWVLQFDVTVLNGVVDIMYNGLGILRRILTYCNRYVVIHRQEITESGQSRSIVNGSYGGKTYHSIINRSDFNSLLQEMGFEIIRENKLNFGNWENGGSSFLLLNKNFVDKKYESHSLRQLRNRIITSIESRKIVLGAGDQMHDPGWICTNQEELDIENADDWGFLFDGTRATHLLAEHVWEHLKNPDKANKNAFDHLCAGGRLRIAVPDGFHPDSDYINNVKPGGVGSGADDHQHLWNYRTLSESLDRVGFTVVLLEYWDEDGNFRTPITWLKNDGFIKRSFKFDERNEDGRPNYTSLIVDALKLKE